MRVSFLKCHQASISFSIWSKKLRQRYHPLRPVSKPSDGIGRTMFKFCFTFTKPTRNFAENVVKGKGKLRLD